MTNFTLLRVTYINLPVKTSNAVHPWASFHVAYYFFYEKTLVMVFLDKDFFSEKKHIIQTQSMEK